LLFIVPRLGQAAHFGRKDVSTILLTSTRVSWTQALTTSGYFLTKLVLKATSNSSSIPHQERSSKVAGDYYYQLELFHLELIVNAQTDRAFSGASGCGIAGRLPGRSGPNAFGPALAV
jgi:hypothetical protein